MSASLKWLLRVLGASMWLAGLCAACGSGEPDGLTAQGYCGGANTPCGPELCCGQGTSCHTESTGGKTYYFCELPAQTH